MLNNHFIKQLNTMVTIIFLLLISRPAVAGSEKLENTFPLPILELKSVVTDWLNSSGFKITQTSSNTGRIQITSVKENKTWNLRLTSRSALATEIAIKTIPGSPDGKQQVTQLWEYISEYINPTSATCKNNIQQVPEAVLSKTESVVCIKAVIKGRDFQISGFIIDPEGFIVCTAHNMSDTRTVTVIFHDGSQQEGVIVKISFHLDLALIQVKRSFETFISLKQGRNLLGMGDRLFSIGCPVNLSGTIYAGVVNSPPRRTEDLPLWQVNMEIHPGSSGSPVFDVQGNIVAVIKGRFRGTESIGFLIPYETLMTFLDERI